MGNYLSVLLQNKISKIRSMKGLSWKFKEACFIKIPVGKILF